MHISGEITGLSLAGTPAGGEAAQFKVYRNVAHTDDDFDADARLMMVKLEFTKNFEYSTC